MIERDNMIKDNMENMIKDSMENMLLLFWDLVLVDLQRSSIRRKKPLISKVKIEAASFLNDDNEDHEDHDDKDGYVIQDDNIDKDDHVQDDKKGHKCDTSSQALKASGR